MQNFKRTRAKLDFPKKTELSSTVTAPPGGVQLDAGAPVDVRSLAPVCRLMCSSCRYTLSLEGFALAGMKYALVCPEGEVYHEEEKETVCSETR